jgi:hypothetical protein
LIIQKSAGPPQAFLLASPAKICWSASGSKFWTE